MDRDKLHPSVTIKLLELVENYEKHHRNQPDPEFKRALKKVLAEFREV